MKFSTALIAAMPMPTARAQTAPRNTKNPATAIRAPTIRWIHPQVVMSNWNTHFCPATYKVSLNRATTPWITWNTPSMIIMTPAKTVRPTAVLLGGAAVEPSASRCVAAMGFSLRGSAPYIDDPRPTASLVGYEPGARELWVAGEWAAHTSHAVKLNR